MHLPKILLLSWLFFILTGFMPQPLAPIAPFTQKQSSCAYTFSHQQIAIAPDCLLAGQIPEFTLAEKVSILSPFLQEWGSGYQPQKHFALYTFETLNLSQKPNLFPLSPELRAQLQNDQAKNQKSLIPSALFAPLVAGDLAFFGSEKEIGMMGPCTKQNYLLAFQQLDGKVIKAGEEFNFNHYLMKLKGYCKGQADQKFLFYGGVCGVASQLFRASLTSPQVEITQRDGHNDRYAKYYGQIVEGDDAAVYETSKRFKFRNTSSADMIIKTIQKWEKTYLFFITDREAVRDQRVEIQKQVNSPLEVQISKTIYQDQENADLHCSSGLGKVRKIWPFYCKNSPQIQQLSNQHFHSKYFKIEGGSF